MHLVVRGFGTQQTNAMKTFISPARRAAFTLLELLIVITIISVLTGLSVGAYNQAMVKARNLEAKTACKAVSLAVQNYRAEMGRMPVSGHADSDVTVELTPDNPLLQVLLGETIIGLNTRRIAFLNPTMGKGGANGLVGKDDHFSLVDPWGQPYRVTMDTNEDNKLANPDAENQDPTLSKDASRQLPSSVIVESAGQDKKFGTLDDVVSWR